MSKMFSISLAIVTLIIGIGIGYVISPEYDMNATEEVMESEDMFGKADKDLDLRYIDTMIAHHKEAMELATQVKDETKRKEVKEIATAILRTEPGLINELYAWKKDWYKNEKEVNAEDVVNLGTHDEKLDLRFLNALIAHHEEGIEMAEEIKMKSSRNDILNNAYEVEEALGKSLEELMMLRKDWYGI